MAPVCCRGLWFLMAGRLTDVWACAAETGFQRLAGCRRSIYIPMPPMPSPKIANFQTASYLSSIFISIHMDSFTDKVNFEKVVHRCVDLRRMSEPVAPM